MKELIEQKKNAIIEKINRNQSLYEQVSQNLRENIIKKEIFFSNVLSAFDYLTYDKVENWYNQMNTILDDDYSVMIRDIEGTRTI